MATKPEVPPSLLPPPPGHRSGIRRAPAAHAPLSMPPPPPMPRESMHRQMSTLQEDLDLIIDATSARLDEMERRQGELEEQMAEREARLAAQEEKLKRTREALRELTRKLQEIYVEARAYTAAIGQQHKQQEKLDARLASVELSLATHFAESTGE